MEGVKSQCFICERPVNDHSTTADGGMDAELEMTVFVLRKVLQAPAYLLEKFLKATPSDCGVGVCPDCRPLLAECRAVHDELCQVKRKWSQVKVKVVNKMEGSATAEGEEVSREGEDVRKGTRRFVINHLQTVVNPLASVQDHQRGGPLSEETRDGETESDAANHSVVDEEGSDDDGDAVQAAEVASAPPQKKAVRRRRERPGVKKLANESQRTKKSYCCLFCPAKFKDFWTLKTHMRVHTGERPFWCGVCGREFTTKGGLDLHQLVHSGEKPHECNLCGKRFGNRSNLSVHVRGHLGEKPWKCPDCGKAFVEKGKLTQHRRVHTGERPFKCNVCGKRFSREDNLSEHKKRLHSAVVKVKSRK